MRRTTVLIVAVILCISAVIFTGCTNNDDRPDTSAIENTLTVGASATPHAEILEQVKEELAEDGYKLNIAIYDDYTVPNAALEGGALEANFFQHKPYLDEYNESNGTSLVEVAAIHYEPFGIYANGLDDIKKIASGATIIIPADDSNETRALLLLAQAGIIIIPENVSAFGDVTTSDIVDNKGYNIVPVQADLAAERLKSSAPGTIAVINGNYAIQAGLQVENALVLEDISGDAAQTYANIVAVRKKDVDSEKIKALVNALKSEKVKKYIEETYKGAVVPMF